MEYRREVPRHPVELRGAVLLEDELATVGWRECAVYDLSTRGVGITFHDHRRDALVGLSVAIEFPAFSDSLSVRLEGTIRHASPAGGAIVRVGIEFDRLSPVERAIAAVLGVLTEDDEPEAVDHTPT